MNRMITSRLSGIAVVLLIPIILLGCNEETCINAVFGVCGLGCSLPCGYASLFIPDFFPACAVMCGFFCYFDLVESCYSLNCTGDPDECAATFEQLQLEAIRFCEEYPDECQQAFDAWVEPLDTEAME